MPAYLGRAGALIPLPRVTVSEPSHERPGSSKTTLGGRIKVQQGPLSRRQWRVGTNGFLLPSESAGILSLFEGGTPPWHWVDSYAQVTNMFTPEQSTLAPGTWYGDDTVEGGAVFVDGAFSPRSLASADGDDVEFGRRDGMVEWPSVVPGIPVSASVYARGSGVLGISWRNWNEDVIDATSVSYDNSSLSRVSITNRTPPEGAAFARLYLNGMRQAAMPQLSWTPDAPAWSTGRGCTRAIVEGLSETPQDASVADPGFRRSALSFTVKEVG